MVGSGYYVFGVLGVIPARMFYAPDPASPDEFQTTA